MLDFPNKIVTLILAFVMLVIFPLTMEYMRADARADTLVINEVVNFIDRVKDKATITQEDLDDLYMGVNAAGGSSYNVRVKRYVRVSTLDENNKLRTLYLSDTYQGKMNPGDMVKVTVEELGISPARRLLWTVLRVDRGSSNFSLVGTVR